MRAWIGLIALLWATTAFAAPPLDGISYSPSGVTRFAQIEAGFDKSRLRADVAQLAPLARHLRT